MPDDSFTEETYLSPDGAEITVCRPVLTGAERERREAQIRQSMCALFEAWWKSSGQEKQNTPFPEETG